MEDNPPVTDRQLLSRLVVIREEARGLVGGGVLDPRNDTRKFRNVPKAHVKCWRCPTCFIHYSFSFSHLENFRLI